MKKIYLMLAGVCLMGNSNAQLDSVAHFNQVIQDLQVYDGNLFLGGNFTQNEGATCYWSAYYNGSTITQHTNLIGGTGVREFAVFDNELYNVGTMQFGGTVGVGVWNGGTWDNGGSTNYSHSTSYADVSALYVESDDGIIRSKTAGGSWTLFHDFAGTGGIGAIMRYGNDLIFGGSFSDVAGVSASNIALWNGSAWSALGAGLDGTVGSMIVYNNELYVAGDFTLAGSTVVDGIAKWDGSAWSDVGGGLAGSSFGYGINDMVVHNSRIYVSGRFDMIGGQIADDFAYWSGTSWTGINYPHPETTLRCIEVYNNEIYLGSFDFSHSHLYRYLGGVGVPENNILTSVTVSPNPSNGVYTIITEEMDITYEVLNSLGQVVLLSEGTSVDITEQDAGIYYLRIKSGSATKTLILSKN